MSLTSGFALQRSSRPLAYVASFVEAAFFCALSAAYVLGALLMCAAASTAWTGRELTVSTDLGAWLGAPLKFDPLSFLTNPLPFLIYPLAVVVYPLVILVYWVPGTRSAQAANVVQAAMLSFLKAALFCAISAVYFLVAMGLYILPAWAAGEVRLGSLWDVGKWFGLLPGWMVLLVIGAYVLLILSYFSRVRLAGVQVAGPVTPKLMAKVVLFAVISGAYFVLASLLYASIAQWARVVKLDPFFSAGTPVESVRGWFRVLPGWMIFAEPTVYLVLLVVWYVFRARKSARRIAPLLAQPFVPFLKTVYFLSLTVAYFLGVPLLYLMLAQWGTTAAGSELGVVALLGAAPIWAYALVFGGYLLLTTIYFSPGEPGANKLELRAFTMFLVAALVAIGCVACQWVAALPFWKGFFSRT